MCTSTRPRPPGYLTNGEMPGRYLQRTDASDVGPIPECSLVWSPRQRGLCSVSPHSSHSKWVSMPSTHLVCSTCVTHHVIQELLQYGHPAQSSETRGNGILNSIPKPEGMPSSTAFRNQRECRPTPIQHSVHK